LLEEVRTDSLTGLGNRGRMEVELAETCEQASSEQPAMLYLFDLNGFKRYNDTFGHPAGDRLLNRLGASLKATIGDEGSAYRIGGDEFCLLLTCAEERFEAVACAATKALTERDRGVEVSASWGAATIPSEAGDPSAALQLADVRMYAQKESRRTAPTSVAIPATEIGLGTESGEPRIEARRG
jgi:diguanylate cyclase (GGDEF)-like protein